MIFKKHLLIRYCPLLSRHIWSAGIPSHKTLIIFKSLLLGNTSSGNCQKEAVCRPDVPSRLPKKALFSSAWCPWEHSLSYFSVWPACLQVPNRITLLSSRHNTLSSKEIVKTTENAGCNEVESRTIANGCRVRKPFGALNRVFHLSWAKLHNCSKTSMHILLWSLKQLRASL